MIDSLKDPLTLSKTFNTVYHNILIRKLQHVGVRGSYRLLQDLQSDSKHNIAVDGMFSTTKVFESGILQR